MEWKDIPEYKDYYQANELGQIRRKSTGKVLKPIRISTGYYFVSIHIKDLGIKKKVLIHRLVASAFLSNPDGLPQVHHKDQDKANNSISNLSWCTGKENVKDFHSKNSYQPDNPKKGIHKITGEVIYFQDYLWYT